MKYRNFRRRFTYSVERHRVRGTPGSLTLSGKQALFVPHPPAHNLALTSIAVCGPRP